MKKLKIRTLREILELQTDLGISFEEGRKRLNDEQKFQFVFIQLKNIFNQKNIRADNKLIHLFKSEDFFIKMCINNFDFIPNKSHINDFNSLTIELLEEIKSYNSWMNTKQLEHLFGRIKTETEKLLSSDGKEFHFIDFEKRQYEVMKTIYNRSIELKWNKLWFNPNLLIDKNSFPKYEKYMEYSINNEEGMKYNLSKAGGLTMEDLCKKFGATEWVEKDINGNIVEYGNIY